ncbi:MAG TPA: branched-chain amino acid ABC transporter permease [Candidatus Binatia bacterium]|nr:branched-chain amino acid ABC transporter permease [Candidatus Binatia bacterium]
MTAAATNLSRTPFLRRYMTFTGLTLAISAAIMVFEAFAQPSIVVNTLVTGGMWALMAAGLAMVFGVMNIPNFAHGELFLLGSFTAFTVFSPIRSALNDDPSLAWLKAFGPVPGMVIAVFVGAAAGLLLEALLFRPLRRRSREQWVMNTFLLTAGVSVAAVNGYRLTVGNDFHGIPAYWDVPPIDLFGVPVSVDRAVVLGIAIVTIGLFALFLQRTTLGRAIRAVAQDETGAQMAGIDLNRIFLLTMALSCAMAALAGASLLSLFPAHPDVGLQPLYTAWFVVILAGLGNVAGAVVGAFIVALLQNLTIFYVGVGWVDVLPTALIILILLFKPSGLFGSAVKGVWEQ